MVYGGVRGSEPFGDNGRWKLMDVFNGLPPLPFIATGGTVTDVTIDGADYKIHTFTTTGTSFFEVTSGFREVEYLIVAGGGGGGGGFEGGGGGAGGMTEGTFSVSPNSYSIIVGAGGFGTRPATNIDASEGENSSAFGVVCVGGGRGAQETYVTASRAFASSGGGSGGGQAWPTTTSGIVAGTAGQGNDGGIWGFVSTGDGRLVGAGGGGKSAAGSNSGNFSPGAGGNGAASSISGTSVTYAGGGGGSLRSGSGASGGSGGGGDGGGVNAQAGSNGLGGGGGAAAGGGSDGSNGGNGGSGVVIIRYLADSV